MDREADLALSGQVQAIVEAATTKSDKIRQLDRLGLTRAQIEKALRPLKVRYQFVRNVLEADKLRRGAAGPPGMAEAPPPPFLEASRIGNLIRLTVGEGGVVRLPREALDVLGVGSAGVVIADLSTDALTLLSGREVLRRVRALVPQWRPGEPLVSEELIAERRREALEDQADG